MRSRPYVAGRHSLDHVNQRHVHCNRKLPNHWEAVMVIVDEIMRPWILIREIHGSNPNNGMTYLRSSHGWMDETMDSYRDPRFESPILVWHSWRDVMAEWMRPWTLILDIHGSNPQYWYDILEKLSWLNGWDHGLLFERSKVRIPNIGMTYLRCHGWVDETMDSYLRDPRFESPILVWHTWGAVMAEWMRPWTLIWEIHGSNPQYWYDILEELSWLSGWDHGLLFERSKFRIPNIGMTYLKCHGWVDETMDSYSRDPRFESPILVWHTWGDVMTEWMRPWTLIWEIQGSNP